MYFFMFLQLFFFYKELQMQLFNVKKQNLLEVNFEDMMSFPLGTKFSDEGLSQSSGTWVCLSFPVCIMGTATITTSQGCNEVSFSYYWKAFITMPGTRRCSIYRYTIINETIYYYDYSESQWLPFYSFSEPHLEAWKRPCYLITEANHRCSETDYEVLSSLSSTLPSPK